MVHWSRLPNPTLWVTYAHHIRVFFCLFISCHLLWERFFLDYRTFTHACSEVYATVTIIVVQYFSNFSTSPALPTVPPSAPTSVNREVKSFPGPTHPRHLHHQCRARDWVSDASESTSSITNRPSSSLNQSSILDPEKPPSPLRFMSPGVDLDGKSKLRIHKS